MFRSLSSFYYLSLQYTFWFFLVGMLKVSGGAHWFWFVFTFCFSLFFLNFICFVLFCFVILVDYCRQGEGVEHENSSQQGIRILLDTIAMQYTGIAAHLAFEWRAK